MTFCKRKIKHLWILFPKKVKNLVYLLKKVTSYLLSLPDNTQFSQAIFFKRAVLKLISITNKILAIIKNNIT